MRKDKIAVKKRRMKARYTENRNAVLQRAESPGGDFKKLSEPNVR